LIEEERGISKLRITGTGFLSWLTAVYVGSTLCSREVLSDTELVVRAVMGHDGNWDIRARNAPMDSNVVMFQRGQPPQVT
jgi:hypothetical protein